MKFIWLLKYFFSAWCLLFMVNAYADNMQLLNGEDRAVFNIHTYNELKMQNGGSRDVYFYRPDGVSVNYREDDNEYTELLNDRGVYRQICTYYKPSGVLKSETTTFQNLSIGTTRLYNKDGSLQKEEVHTPDDWLERLTRLAQEHFNVDVWNVESGQIYEQYYQGMHVIELLHLNGEKLSRMGFDTDVKFAFLNYKNLDVIVIGERHLIRSPNMTRDPRIGIRQYMVDGQEIFLDH